MKKIIPLLLSCFLYLPSAFAGNHIALKDILQTDGSISPSSGMTGSIDFSGLDVGLDPCKGPVFRPIVAPGWNALGSGLNNYVRALAISGTDVYVGGDFTTAGGNSANYIARWDGSSWTALGSGLNSPVNVIATSGNDVYVGGLFTTAGGNSANYIARWNGSSWSALGSGLNDYTAEIAISGSDVYVGGRFTTAGGNSANRIARWNGSSWSALGSGLNNIVSALAISGSDVYVGGWFTTAGGNSANYIARWDGSSWSALGSGLNHHAYAIAVAGSDVYVGGNFTTAGGNSANHIARWDGSSWSALGSGLNNRAFAIAIFGSDMYVGGDFTNAGGNNSADYIARWDGSSWLVLGSGLSSNVNGIAMSGSDVYAGGRFINAGGNGANYVARWEEAPLPIEWIAFEATEWKKGSALLTWHTASETQNDYFLVQHSTDGISFRELARIPGAGNSQMENHYEYPHEIPSPGTNYYRLKQVDFDGRFEYSHIVSLKMKAERGIEVYPNPFSGDFQIEIISEQDEFSARIYDAICRQVWQGSLRSGLQSLELTGLPSGIFWLEVDFGNLIKRVKIAKQ